MKEINLGIWFPVREMSHLCIRCRDQGVIAEADWAVENMCRGHLAADRINEIWKAAWGQGEGLNSWQRRVLEDSFTEGARRWRR